MMVNVTIIIEFKFLKSFNVKLFCMITIIIQSYHLQYFHDKNLKQNRKYRWGYFLKLNTTGHL